MRTPPKAPDLKSRNEKFNAEAVFKIGFTKLNYFCPLTPFIPYRYVMCKHLRMERTCNCLKGGEDALT